MPISRKSTHYVDAYAMTGGPCDEMLIHQPALGDTDSGAKTKTLVIKINDLTGPAVSTASVLEA